MKTNEFPIGDYKVFFVKIGEQESTLPLTEGAIYYTVRVDKETYLDTANLFEAEILSRLVRVENLLKKK